MVSWSGGQREMTNDLNVSVKTNELHTNIIHSFSSLSYGRSKASSPNSVIQSFLLQMRVSSPFLKVIQ